MQTFFGVVIPVVKDIFLLYPDGQPKNLEIYSIITFKVKRTMYWNILFKELLKIEQ